MTMPGFCAEGALVGRNSGARAVRSRMVRMQSGLVVPAIDSCHATQPVTASDGSSGYAYAACECGCWATTHDAGCFAC